MRLPTQTEIANCRSKVVYASEAEAKARYPGNTLLRAYRCPICHQWHITGGVSGKVGKAAKAAWLAALIGGVKPSRLKRRRKWK